MYVCIGDGQDHFAGLLEKVDVQNVFSIECVHAEIPTILQHSSKMMYRMCPLCRMCSL